MTCLTLVARHGARSSFDNGLHVGLYFAKLNTSRTARGDEQGVHMAIRKTNKGTVSVSHKGALVATGEVAEAVAVISNMRATKKQCTNKEKTAKDLVEQAAGNRARIILNEDGDVICEIIKVVAETTKLDDFIIELERLYPKEWAVLMDSDPRAIELTKVAATKEGVSYRVMPK